jgi:hypothetical protein
MTTLLKLLPLLEQKLIPQQVSRITFNLIQPVFHHDHGDTGSRDGVCVWKSVLWRFGVFFTRATSLLIKLIHGLTRGGFLPGKPVRRTARFLLITILVTACVANFFWTGPLISIIYTQITTF